MHILFLTDNFPPEVNAPASRTFEHCREWVKAGHRVTVITCVPNFPRGEIYKGYRNQIWQTEMIDGIQVIRVWTYISANEGFFKRILDYNSYMVSAIMASPFVSKPDLVVATSPLLFTACAGYAVSRIKNIPFVFELRDLWPESIKVVGAMKNSSVLRFLERLEMFLYQKATKIVSVTKSYKQILTKRGINPAKIEIITNGVDLSRFRPMPRDVELENHYDLQGKFVAGYLGTHGMAHALETLLKVAAKSRERADGNNLRFILLGDGARKKVLTEKAQAMDLDNVIFIDSVPKEEVPRFWSLLDVSIIHLKKNDLFKTVIPSKLFESMGMGVPVLHGLAGESAEIVKKEDAGIVFEPENAEELYDKLVKLSNDPELYSRLKSGCLRAAGNYDRSKLASRMLQVLDQTMRC